MKITSYVSFLYCLCVMLASPTVQASEVRTAILRGNRVLIPLMWWETILLPLFCFIFPPPENDR